MFQTGLIKTSMLLLIVSSSIMIHAKSDIKDETFK